MYQIALCDDEPEELKKTEDMLKLFRRFNNARYPNASRKLRLRFPFPKFGFYPACVAAINS